MRRTVGRPGGRAPRRGSRSGSRRPTGRSAGSAVAQHATDVGGRRGVDLHPAVTAATSIGSSPSRRTAAVRRRGRQCDAARSPPRRPGSPPAAATTAPSTIGWWGPSCAPAAASHRISSARSGGPHARSWRPRRRLVARSCGDGVRASYSWSSSPQHDRRRVLVQSRAMRRRTCGGSERSIDDDRSSRGGRAGTARASRRR